MECEQCEELEWRDCPADACGCLDEEEGGEEEDR